MNASDIRQKLYCADCKNCKLQVWDESTKLDKLTNRGYMTELRTDGGTVFFLVRCMWLKDNVIEPLKLRKCEGRQTKGDGGDE